MPQVPSRRVSLVLALAAGLAAGCARTNNNTPRGPSTPSTLEAERRVRYLIAAAVSGDPTGMGPAGTTDQLRQWVGTYLAQVGLPPAGNSPGPGDVELRLSLAVHGGSVLLFGTAVMVAVANGQVIDQWSTSEHVEPATSFARTMARELVEAMVHSTRLATYADAASGGRAAPGAPPAGFTMPAVALMPGPPPAPEGSVTPPPASGVPPPADPAGSSTAAARAHAKQALALYDLKRFQEAFGEFEQAYLIEQDPALLYDMAQCQRKLGNNEEALHFYKTYLRRVPRGPSAVEAEKRAREIEDAMNRAKRTSAP